MSKMKISDFLVNKLKKYGVDRVFGLNGSGTALQIFDSLARTDGIDYFCTLHEQAAGFAADAYASLRAGMGACYVTSGPGVGNIFTCVSGSFYNSTPVVYIMGQSPTTAIRYNDELRFFGYHETNNIKKTFEDITKYTTIIDRPEIARYEIEKALHLAVQGRPGPVVIALPDDITWLEIEPEEQEGFTEPEVNLIKETQVDLSQIAGFLEDSSRPIFVAGRGVKIAGAQKELLDYAKKNSIPIAPAYSTRDLMADDDELNAGSFGLQGLRAGNFAIQTADLIIVLGSRLDFSESGREAKLFGKNAKVIHVDIDNAELEKCKNYNIHTDIKINMDVKVFFNQLKQLKNTNESAINNRKKWIALIAEWKTKYNSKPDSKGNVNAINPYYFLDVLSNEISPQNVFVTDTSTSRNYFFQYFRFSDGQKAHTWFNYCCLGYGICASIGACVALNRPVVSIMGDGALHFNIQELATISFNHLDIKTVIFDNGGYANIARLQDNYLGKRYYGSTREYGLPLPEIMPIVKAYGIPAIELSDPEKTENSVKEWLNTNGPAVLILKTDIHFWTSPFKKGMGELSDMTPALPDDELKEQYERALKIGEKK